MLNAQINTYGLRTSVFFAYGTTTNYVNTLTRIVEASIGEGYVPVQMPLTGLAPGTTYHLRVGALNPNGIFRWGADQTFTTVGLAPTLLYGPVVTNGSFFAQFSGTPNSTYTIEATTSLRPINWQKFTNVTTTASGIIPLQVAATNPPTRFFRTVQPWYD